MRNVVMLVVLVLVAACGGDEAPPDACGLEADAAELVDAAGLEADAAELDAAPCGGEYERCCPPTETSAGCVETAICNFYGICEPTCFPYCPDAAPQACGHLAEPCCTAQPQNVPWCSVGVCEAGVCVGHALDGGA